MRNPLEALYDHLGPLPFVAAFLLAAGCLIAWLG